MTFPRRLTPSDKERATIVQQRMTPGGALGVGSRHVRSGTGTGSTVNAPSSTGGPIGSLEQLDLTGHSSSFTFDPSTAGTVIGDASAMAYDDGTGFGAEVGIRMDEVGWYQADAMIQVGGTPTQTISLHVNSPEGLGLAGRSYMPTGITGTKELAASTLFYVDVVPSYVVGTVVNPGGATITSGILNVIKWS